MKYIQTKNSDYIELLNTLNRILTRCVQPRAESLLTGDTIMITPEYQLSIEQSSTWNNSQKFFIYLNKIKDFGYDSLIVFDPIAKYNLDAKEALKDFFENLAFYAPYEVDDDDLINIEELTSNIFKKYSNYVITRKFSEFE